MGILNVTPDSFHDGGRFNALEDGLRHAAAMVEQGAHIIDVGGESTRPGAAAVSVDEEIDRVLPIIAGIRQRFDVAISVDTSKAEVMRAALGEDIDLINDVRALQSSGSLEVTASSDVSVCLMHMKGEPRTMQEHPTYDDVVAEVREFFRQRIAACEAEGIHSDRIILDVGFGFGKTPAHNLTLINQLHRFSDFGLPLLVGLSRKSTIGLITEDRLAGSISGALAAVNRGAKIVRVHDVAETVSALGVWQSILQEDVTQ